MSERYFQMKKLILYVYLVRIIFCKCDGNKNVPDKSRVILALWEGFRSLYLTPRNQPALIFVSTQFYCNVPC